jgi:hypothetical protein
MFIVYYKNDINAGKIIRPSPFISMSYSLDRNKNSLIGGKYTITLTGTLLSNAGSPINDYNPESILAEGPNYENNPNGNYKRTDKQLINLSDRAYSMFFKQQAIRALFARDGQRMEMSSIRNDEPIIVFYPTVESISFDEGTYINTCNYTINLTTDILLDKDNKFLDYAKNTFYDGDTDKLNDVYHVENYSDEWAIEPDESFGKTANNILPIVAPETSSLPYNDVPRIYRLTRNISATGKTIYSSTGSRTEAWEQAKKYVKCNILKENIQASPSKQLSYFPSYEDTLGSGLLNLTLPPQSTSSSAYNHVRSEKIDKTGGTYSLSDSWIISPDNAVESYSLSLSSNTSIPTLSISINGTIKGLSDNVASDFINNNKYQNAYNKLNILSNNFTFIGPGCAIFKRAQNTTALPLNIIPASRSINVNMAAGEITYNVTYNNRPSNFITNASSENITITDTYPGDVFSIIPTINRLNGPILQYTGGRTEYRRDLNIELNVSRHGIGYYKMNNRGSYLNRKPSANPAIALDLRNIIYTCSPANEPGIRKYFLNPVSENWDPKSGSYSVQISWTYELDK